MSYSLLTHLGYNLWANKRLADTLHGITDEIYFHENKSSFPSIAKTVLHLWGAQEVWLARLKGTNLTAWPESTDPQNRNRTLAELVESSVNLLSFVQSRGMDFLHTTYAYKSMKGDPAESTVEETLFHVVNHGSYHRGQITTMLREAGVEKIAGTDLILYLRSLPK
jgi:uncharacterized damage-inducible protein DinB